MITNVYVDGFNLYYGCLKNTPYRWLDLAKLCQLMLPKNQINTIKYYTAKVSARPADPDQPVRQQTYIRALETLPNLEVIYGHYLQSKVWMPLVSPAPGQPKTVQVIKTEEKGSDVNLAVHLLNDAHFKRFEMAVVISNDSDLLEPIRIVREQLKLDVGILNPNKRSPSIVLRRAAKFFIPIRDGVLNASQFPNSLTDPNGAFTKPAKW